MGTIDFKSTVNGAFALALNAGSTGHNTFESTVGNSAALSSLATTGLTSIGGNITTTGDQTYNQAVTLAADAAMPSIFTVTPPLYSMSML